ncbi:MAG: glycosyltransferase family 2 protein [Dehalococcoidia bacterium]
MLSVVIPCYNEAKSLPSLIEKCEVLVGDDVEIILVDNGSSDGTPEILGPLEKNETGLRSVRLDINTGYGNGIMGGLKAAKGDTVGWTHADLQADPADTLTAYELYKKSPTPTNLFVKGARTGRPLADRIFTIGMAIFETIFMRTRMWDINAQPTLMPRSLYDAWQNAPGDFSLDLYAYYQAKTHNLEIQRIPVYFGPRTFGESHWNTGMVSRIKFIRRTLAYSWHLRKSLARSSASSGGSRKDLE